MRAPPPFSAGDALGEHLEHLVEVFSLDRISQKIEHVYSTMFGADLARAARRIFKKDEK